MAPPLRRPMRIRWGPSRGFKYYLDTRSSVEDKSCLCFEVSGQDVTARLVNCRS